MKKLLKNKITYIISFVLVIGIFAGYFGEGLIYAVTNRNEVLATKNGDSPKVASPLAESK